MYYLYLKTLHTNANENDECNVNMISNRIVRIDVVFYITFTNFTYS